MYQRGKIQAESIYYEARKHDGSFPLVGVNTFLPKEGQEEEVRDLELIRSSDEEKRSQIENLDAFKALHALDSQAAISSLQEVASNGGNIFGELMKTVKCNSLGQISSALYGVGGEYRRNM